MVHALFGFQGRLTRLAYLGWFLASLVLMVAITAAFLAIGAGAATVIVSRAGPTIMGVLMALTVLVFGVWTGLALHTKRIRDTGFSPLLVIGSVMVIFSLDAIIFGRGPALTARS